MQNKLFSKIKHNSKADFTSNSDYTFSFYNNDKLIHSRYTFQLLKVQNNHPLDILPPVDHCNICYCMIIKIQVFLFIWSHKLWWIYGGFSLLDKSDLSAIPVLWFYSPIICKTRVLVLALVSSSKNTICCHVPSNSCPSLNGTVSEGPTSDAFTWDLPFPSCHLCSCS